MMVLSIKDLGETDGIAAIRTARRKLWGESMSQEDAREIYDLVGGRMSIVMSLAKHRDMKAAARDKVEMEKQWLLSKIGLIPDHDDGAYRFEVVANGLADIKRVCRRDGRAEVELLQLAPAARMLVASGTRLRGQKRKLTRQVFAAVAKKAETSEDPKVTWFRAREVMWVDLAGPYFPAFVLY